MPDRSDPTPARPSASPVVRRTVIVAGAAGLLLGLVAGPRLFSTDAWGTDENVWPEAAAVSSARDAELRPPATWGQAAFEDVLAAIDELTPTTAPMRDRIMAANLLISRMDNGSREPVTDWSDYLESGLRNGSCGRRAMLLAGVIRHWDPSIPVRFAGMASVPGQASHTTLEVRLPGATDWSWFDPSSGIVFTEDGLIGGRILSQNEAFADPSIVDRIGPIAPQGPRVGGSPRKVRLEPPLTDHAAAVPGFSRHGFPLRRMMELSTAWGSGDPLEPRPGRVRLHVDDAPRIEAARVRADGSIERMVLRDEERRLTWHDRAGVSSSGINVVPVIAIEGLEPGQRVQLLVRAVPRHRDIRLRPLVNDGARLARATLTRDPEAAGRDPVLVLTVEFVAHAERAVISILHGGDDRNEHAVVLSYEVRPVDPAPA